MFSTGETLTKAQTLRLPKWVFGRHMFVDELLDSGHDTHTSAELKYYVDPLVRVLQIKIH